MAYTAIFHLSLLWMFVKASQNSSQSSRKQSGSSHFPASLPPDNSTNSLPAASTGTFAFHSDSQINDFSRDSFSDSGDRTHSLFCFYHNAASLRSGESRFKPNQIASGLCTHVVYAFAGWDVDTFAVGSTTKEDEALYASLKILKKSDPRLKTLLAIGGDEVPYSQFHAMVRSTAARSAFARSLHSFLLRQGFDGVTLQWTHPAVIDRTYFILLLEDLVGIFRSPSNRLLVTVAASVSENRIDAYDVVNVSRLADKVILLAYDFQGGENAVVHHSPLFPSLAGAANGRESVIWGVNEWINRGASAEKIVLTVPAFGRPFKLDRSADSHIGDRASRRGAIQGDVIHEILTYYEITAKLKEGRATEHWSYEVQAPYVTILSDGWVGYDNIRSASLKTEWAKRKRLAGMAVWELGFDDFNGTFGKKFTLTNAIRARLGSSVHRPAIPGGEVVIGNASSARSTAVCPNGQVLVHCRCDVKECDGVSWWNDTACSVLPSSTRQTQVRALAYCVDLDPLVPISLASVTASTNGNDGRVVNYTCPTGYAMGGCTALSNETKRMFSFGLGRVSGRSCVVKCDAFSSSCVLHAKCIAPRRMNGFADYYKWKDPSSYCFPNVSTLNSISIKWNMSYAAAHSWETACVNGTKLSRWCNSVNITNAAWSEPTQLPCSEPPIHKTQPTPIIKNSRVTESSTDTTSLITPSEGMAIDTDTDSGSADSSGSLNNDSSTTSPKSMDSPLLRRLDEITEKLSVAENVTPEDIKDLATTMEQAEDLPMSAGLIDTIVSAMTSVMRLPDEVIEESHTEWKTMTSILKALDSCIGTFVGTQKAITTNITQSDEIEIFGRNQGTKSRLGVKFLLGNVQNNGETTNRGRVGSAPVKTVSSETLKKFIKKGQSINITLQVGVWIPSRAFRDGTSKRTVPTSFIVFTSGKMFPDVKLKGNSSSVVASRVVSANAFGLQVDNLPPSSNVAVALRHTVSGQNVRCVFWDFEENDGFGGWSTSGCTASDTFVLFNETYTKCSCNHLTHFALLLDVSARGEDSEDLPKAVEDSLKLITMIGCGLSELGLLATIAVLLAFKEMRRHILNQVHVQLCIALTITNVVVVFGLDLTEPRQLCQSMAALLHYAILVAFAWMAVEAIFMYKYLVFVFWTPTAKFFFMCLMFAWVIPAIPVGVVLAVKPETYVWEERELCWISDQNVFLYGFIGPLSLILLFNGIVFGLVLRAILKSRTMSPNKDSKQRRDHVIRRVRSAILIVSTLGLTWTFGLLQIGHARIIFAYAFAISTSIQGLLIFFLYCLFNNKLHKTVKEHLEKKKRSSFSSSSN
eukprot:m.9315 g.9315  ORF g.9315 m.9315 type:complete len:1317 (+) comp21269_c0_seq1:161-4111(+)